VENLKKKISESWLWFISKLFPRYTLIVSYNDTWGDQDDQEYIVKKFFKKQPNFLRFKTHEGDIVEIRGADGLNYRIEEL
tara:strand:+ start:327 stop:566 length:240 start_codon:yes stop_codon:yes gene_type:complete